MKKKFKYDLHICSRVGTSPKVMIAAHGMGDNYTIAEWIQTEKTLVSFNFPDHDYASRGIPLDKTTFGTIDELLPLLYIIKEYVLEKGHGEIDLYGFSAGGGAVINSLGALNTARYDDGLKSIGISQNDKQKMLWAIQKGKIILDTPLKSVSEIIDFRGASEELLTFAKRYQANDMEPIDALKYLEGLSLHFIVHFQDPDEVLSNRDDALYFQRLKKYNSNGTTKLIIGNDGGHLQPHPTLWKSINQETI